MKRIGILIFTLALCLTGCSKQYDVSVTIPAGNESAFAYSETEVTSIGQNITVITKPGTPDCAVILKEVGSTDTKFESMYLTPGMSVKFKTEKGVWYQIGIAAQNPAEEDYKMVVTVKNAEVRIV